MNVIGKIGFALAALGGIIIVGLIIWQILRVFILSFIPWYIMLPVVAIILGFVLMLSSAIYDRYKSVKTEEVHEKV